MENTGLDKAAMRVVQDISFAYPDNEYVVSQCNDVMHHLGETFAGSTEALLEDRLRGLANLSVEGGNALEWQCVTSEDGQVYYYNAVTGETSWEQPQVSKDSHHHYHVYHDPTPILPPAPLSFDFGSGWLGLDDELLGWSWDSTDDRAFADTIPHSLATWMICSHMPLRCYS